MKKRKSKPGKADATQALYRQWCLLRHVPQRRRMGTQELCQRLADEEGLQVSLRTVQRDLKQLETIFPLSSDDRNPAGWCWMEGAKIEIIPGMDSLTAFTFRLAGTFLAGLVPPSVRQPMEPYFQRADEILARTPGLELGGWAGKIRVLSRNDLLMAPEIDPAVHAAVCEALLHGRQCRITYASKARGGKGEERVIHPLGLVLVDKVIYVVATYWDFQDVRQLALHRVHKAEVMEAKSRIPEGFSLLQNVESGEFRYVLREKRIRLKLRMDAGRAAHLTETKLAEDQRLRTSGNGRVTVEATVQDTLQLRFWLKGMGADLEVIAPTWLRQEFQTEARALASLYGKA